MFCKIVSLHLYSTLLPQVSGRQQTDCAGAHHGNLTPPRIAPSCPHCLRLWLGRSIITRLLTRVGPVSPAAMRNSPPQAVLWTDGYRSAPSSAVFNADSCTGGLGASSSVASALSQGPLVSGRIPLPDISFSKHKPEIVVIDTPSTGQIGPGCCSTPEDPPHPMFAAIYVEVLPALEITSCSPYETSLAGWHHRHSGLVRLGSDNSKKESPDQHGSSAQKRQIPLQGLLPFHAFAYIKVEGLRFSVLTGSSLSPPRLAL